jgi:F-type H+-transporting ATPase subunit b
MELFRIEPGLVLWTWISFGILLLLMYKFVLPALLGSIREREDKIAKAVDDADAISKRLSCITEERAEIIKKAQADGDELLRRIRDKGDGLKKKLSKKAEESAAEILEQARIKAQEERNLIIQALKRDLADFVCETSEKLVGKSFTEEDDRKFTRELAERL